jgi:hypothetical protein
MSYKSRGNWSVMTCLKEDCVNRGLCEFCLKGDLYIAQKDFDAVGKETPVTPQSLQDAPQPTLSDNA